MVLDLFGNLYSSPAFRRSNYHKSRSSLRLVVCFLRDYSNDDVQPKNVYADGQFFHVGNPSVHVGWRNNGEDKYYTELG